MAHDFYDLESFFIIFIGIYLFILLILFVSYIFKSIAIAGMAKRRGIDNSWLGFIPIAQSFMLGSILDNINAYRHKKTYYGIILLTLNIIYVALSSSAVWLFQSNISVITVSLLTPTIRIFNLIIAFLIFKDYTPKSWVLFGILSAIFQLDFIFIFCLRKKVPVSMCFSQQDEWQFEMNQPQLQMLWNGFHSQPVKTQSWAEFLMMNFVPAQQNSYQQYNNMGNPYAGQNNGNQQAYSNTGEYNTPNNNQNMGGYDQPKDEANQYYTSPDLDNQNNQDDFKQE